MSSVETPIMFMPRRPEPAMVYGAHPASYVSSEQPLPIQPMTMEQQQQQNIGMRGGGACSTCCGVCTGICCAECCDCCCCPCCCCC